MNDLQMKIQEAIEKDMPKQVGENLKKLLEEGEKAKERLLKLEKNFELAQENFNKLEAENRKLLALKNRAEELEEKADGLEAKERALEIEILKIKLAESEKRADMVNQYTQGLVRNTSFRKKIFDSDSQMQDWYFDGQGVWHQPQPINSTKNHEETREED